MKGNVITANFRNGQFVHTDPLWQYDYGQVLRFTGVSLPETFEVHFSNAKEFGQAKTAIGTADGVLIPDEYLISGKPVFAWIFLHVGDDDGETVYMAQIPVNKRSVPSDEAPTPQEQSAITQAIAALNSAVVDVQEAVDAADSARASATSAASSATAAAASEAGVEADADRASNAATAAESAQTAAAAAQAGAETAQTGAESARDEAAEASAAQITAIANKGAEVLESIPADYTDLSEDVSNLKSAKAYLPYKNMPIELTIQSGWINRTDLSVYNGNDICHISIPVNSGDVYAISGWSQNITYPCAFGVEAGGSTAVIPLLLQGYSVSYENAQVTIPNGVTTLYVNGIPSTNPISINKIVRMTQKEFDGKIESINIGTKAVFNGKELLVKRKYNNAFDAVIRMTHIGGNKLFSFDNMYLADDDDQTTLNNNFEPSASAEISWSMKQTDWFGPYKVRAVNNVNGDHPSNVYYTGGNHRSNNTQDGGGVTAAEMAFDIRFDGLTPVVGQIYNPKCIDVRWTNAVQAYNTSKDDGTGRAVLRETWNLHIEDGTYYVSNRIVALEDIVIITYYGLQAYAPNWTCVFVGGSSRTPFITNENKNSGNKTCRSIIAKNNYFNLEMHIGDTDLGMFDYTNFSISTYGNKIYGSLVEGYELALAENEEYNINGFYKFS